jgi:hypothetical protein
VENYLYLNQEAMAEAEAWIEKHSKYWNHQFDSIEKYLENDRKNTRRKFQRNLGG